MGGSQWALLSRSFKPVSTSSKFQSLRDARLVSGGFLTGRSDKNQDGGRNGLEGRSGGLCVCVCGEVCVCVVVVVVVVCVCVLFTNRHASGLQERWWCCTVDTASCSPVEDKDTAVVKEWGLPWWKRSKKIWFITKQMQTNVIFMNHNIFSSSLRLLSRSKRLWTPLFLHWTACVAFVVLIRKVLWNQVRLSKLSLFSNLLLHSGAKANAASAFKTVYVIL